MGIYYQEKRQMIKGVIVLIASLILLPLMITVKGFNFRYNEYMALTDSSLNYEVKFSILDIVKNNELEVCLTGEDGVLLEKLTGTNCVMKVEAREFLFDEKEIVVFSGQYSNLTRTQNLPISIMSMIIILGGFLLVVIHNLLYVVERVLALKKKDNKMRPARDLDVVSSAGYMLLIVLTYFTLFLYISNYWNINIVGNSLSAIGKQSWSLIPSFLYIVLLLVYYIIGTPIKNINKAKIVLEQSNGNYMFEILETSEYEERLIDIIINNSPISREDATKLIRNGGCAYNLSKESVEKINSEFRRYDAKIYYVDNSQITQ